MEYEYTNDRAITDFIYTEPITVDVSHIYTSNYEINPADYSEYTDTAKSYTNKMIPFEGNTECFFDKTTQWKLLRLNDSDVKPTWAIFGVNAKLILNYVYCDIIVPKSGTYQFDLSSACSVYIRINGTEMFSKNEFRRVGSDNSLFEAHLNEGRNSFLMMLLNVNLHSINSFSLILKNCSFKISLPVHDFPERTVLEEDFKKLYISDSVIHSDKSLVLLSDEPLNTEGEYILTIHDGNEAVLVKKHNISSGTPLNFCVCDMNKLKNGIEYQLDIKFTHDLISIAGPVFDFEKISSIVPPRDLSFPKRKEWLKKLYLEFVDSAQAHTRYFGVYAALASLLNGEKVDEELIFAGIDYINHRYDCSDFCMHGLILILKYFSDKLSEKCIDASKRCILNFKYNEEDGGRSMMFCRSENHRILFASLEYITGIMYPDEIFSQSKKTGKFQSERGKITVENWIDEKLSYGFTEWHSNTYYEEDMIALLNIINFSYDEITKKAHKLLDLICTLIASHASHGIMATTHGRAYEKHLLYPITEPISHLTWLITGISDEIEKRISTGIIVTLCSSYTPPGSISQIASEFPLRTSSRMGYFTDRAGAPCVCFRTKKYSLSSLIEYRHGTYGQQTHPGQLLINNNIPVFVTAFENASKNTRPSYWGGQYRMPKTVCTSNTLAYLYNIETDVGFTHCYFPTMLFDEYILHDNHIFGNVDNTYVCIYNPDGFSLTSCGMYKGRELICSQKKALWFIETGTDEEYSSFDEFIEKCLECKHSKDTCGFVYQSPNGYEIGMYFDKNCTIDANIAKGTDMLIENKFVKEKYGVEKK